MSNSTRKLHQVLLTAAVVSASYSVAACSRDAKNAKHDQNSAAVLASVGNIAESDLKRPDIGFFLVCATGVTVKGEVATVNGKDVVKFSGNQVKEHDKCSMDVKAPVTDKNYVWFGKAKDGSLIPGLLYSSDERLVENKALKLQLFKLYSINADDTFSVTVDIQLALPAGVPAPTEANAAASLICSPTEQYSGSYKKAADEKQATLTFKTLKAKEFTSKTCDKISVLADKKIYSGQAPDLLIKDAKKGTSLKFPVESGKRYTLSDTSDDGNCLHFEGPTTESGKVCIDKRDVILPLAQSFFVARVEARVEGKIVSYLLSSGETGIGQLAGNKLSLSAVNRALAKDANAIEKGAYHFYKEAAAPALMRNIFDTEAVRAAAADHDKMDPALLADVKFLNIANVYVHGFHEETKKVLDARSDVFWMAVMNGRKAGEKDLNFIITGNDRYFYSSAAPASVDGDLTYIDMDKLSREMAAFHPDLSWHVYALKGETLANKNCELTNLMDAASLKNSDQLHPGNDDSKADPAIDACKVDVNTFNDANLKTYELTPTVYIWDWYEVKI